MYLYKKSMFDRFKFKFDGLENIETSYSQLLQDMFVLAVTNGKKGGTFLELGADSAQFINNTYLLETQFGWNGVSIDINPASKSSYDMYGRKSKFYLGDALQLNYDYILSENFSGDRINFLQLDIEPNTNTLSCLKKIPLDMFRFDVAVLEHDHYDTAMSKESNDNVRKEMREIMTNNGYVMVAGNISNLDYSHELEDWWVDGQYFNKYYIEKFKRENDDVVPAHIFMGLE